MISIHLTLILFICTLTNAFALTSDERDRFVSTASKEVGTAYYNTETRIDNYYIADECKYNKWFYDIYYSGLVGTIKTLFKDKDDAAHRAPWCATFVCWCASQAGIGDFPFDANVNGIQKWYSDRGRYQLGSWYTPKPGDVVFFSDGSQYYHIGIVKTVEETIWAPTLDQTKILITTIEGDIIDGSYSKVAERDFERDGMSWGYSEIVGFGEN